MPNVSAYPHCAGADLAPHAYPGQFPSQDGNSFLLAQRTQRDKVAVIVLSSAGYIEPLGDKKHKFFQRVSEIDGNWGCSYFHSLVLKLMYCTDWGLTTI